jgi:hypothetical protein
LDTQSEKARASEPGGEALLAATLPAVLELQRMAIEATRGVRGAAAGGVESVTSCLHNSCEHKP